MTAMRAPSVQEQAPEAVRVERRLAAVGRVHAAPVRRLHPARWFLFTDLCFGLIAYGLALTSGAEVAEGPLSPQWSMLVPLAITFLVFSAMGLYERELLSLRALHLLTLAKGVLWSAAIGALVVYLLHLPIAFQSRFTVVTTFTLFFVFAALVRTVVLPRLLGRRFREDMAGTLVVGWPYRTEPLRERLRMLAGFSHVTLVDGGREQRLVARVRALLRRRTEDDRLAFGSLFIDAGSVTQTQTLDLITAGQREGVVVYVVSNRLRPLSGRRLLIELFEAPIVRIRRAPGRLGRAPTQARLRHRRGRRPRSSSSRRS